MLSNFKCIFNLLDDIPIKFKDVINIGDIVAIKGNGYGNVIEVWFALVEGETVSQFHIKYLNEQDLIKGNLYMVLLLREILFEKRLFTLKCSKSQGMKLKTCTEFLKPWLKWQ